VSWTQRKTGGKLEKNILQNIIEILKRKVAGKRVSNPVDLKYKL
jgi:hypothetical protein